MNYSKREFGKDLKKQIDDGYNPKKIGSWAHRLYLEYCGKIDKDLEENIIDLFVLEEGPEFELHEIELLVLANKLIAEGDKEELSQPLLEIKEVATTLGDHWLMCPLCQEAWEDHSTYAMVRCPKCNEKLHNPEYKKTTSC